MAKFKVMFYETSGGRKVVKDFIRSLEAPTQSKVVARISLLKEFGPGLMMPYAKPLGNNMFKLRVRGRQEVRVFYAHVGDRTFYLLHVFVKKTRATPRKELIVAQRRKKEIDSL